MFVTSKHNFSSILFAKCVRGRHLDKLTYQEKGLDSSFAKFEYDTFKEQGEHYFDQLTAEVFETLIAAMWKVQNLRRLL